MEQRKSEKNTTAGTGVSLTEDWTVVLLGFLIIAIFLIGWVLPVPTFGWANFSDLFEKVFSLQNLMRIGIQFLLVFSFTLAGSTLTGRPVRNSLIVFPLIYVLTVLALIVAGNKEVKALNLEAVIASLAIGLLVGNIFTLPAWFRSALTTELFVKIGLVLLGTSIIFGDLLKAGGLGLIQALAVVISVWYFAYWVCKKLKVDDELALMLSSAVSICGVSAAIATAGAIKGDPKKLSYVISLVLITAIPMMIFMPYIAKYYGFSQELTGAWLGGSIDTTGAVVASGTLVGETALKVSTIVKFSQNVLLGLAAFAISIYWSWSHKTNGDASTFEKPTLGVIWERFPKFVIGFIAASFLFSFFLFPATIVNVKDGLKSVQGLWFVLAFTSIGLETKFSDLFHVGNRKPMYAFLLAQLFNILITLLIAWYLFGGSGSR
jgi:uncharacterized integral membrane protein (TIGR00698 family)